MEWIKILLDTPERELRLRLNEIEEEVKEYSRRIRLNEPLTIEEKVLITKA